MKINVSTNEFRTAFNFVKNGASTRDVKPVLMNVKMIANDDSDESVTLMASDGQLGVRTDILGGNDIEEAGETMLPLKVINSLLSMTSAERVTFETPKNDCHLHVTAGSFKSKLAVEESSGFNNIAEFNYSDYFQIDAGTLIESLQKTCFATDMQNTHFALSGVHVEVVDNKVFFVATDGRRLALVSHKISVFGNPEKKDAVIPLKTVKLLTKVPFSNDTVAKIALKDDGIYIQIGLSTIFSQTIEGRFPNWRQINEKAGQKQAVIPLTELKQIVSQTHLLTTEKNPGIEFILKDNTLTLKSRGTEVGEAVATSPAQYNEDEDKFLLDGRFVLDYLNRLSPLDTVFMTFDGNNRPVIFTTGNSYSYTVMPLE